MYIHIKFYIEISLDLFKYCHVYSREEGVCWEHTQHLCQVDPSAQLAPHSLLQ